MRNEYKYEEVYFLRYNSGEREFKHEHVVIDQYELDEFFGEVAAQDVRKIYIETLKIKAPYAFDIINDTQVDVSYISINVNALDSELNKLAKAILEQALEVSGDDDVYDYFPDLVFAFYQICDRYKRFDIYNDVIAVLNNFENTIGDDKWEKA